MNELQIMKLENRIAALRGRGEVMNGNLIKKAERQLRKLKSAEEN